MRDRKGEYQRPVLTAYGSIEKITAGSSTGSYLDATFQQNTLKSDLTFS